MADPTLEAALDAARTYCGAVDQRREMALEEFMVAVHRAASTFYAAVLALPDMTPPEASYPDRWPEVASVALYHDLRDLLGPLDHYREVFNPYEDESQPVDGSLADGIVALYGAAVTAMSIADRATLTDAAFGLQLEFRIHSGHHAVDLLRAIHAHRFYPL